MRAYLPAARAHAISAREVSRRTRFAMDDLAFLDGAGALLRSFPNLRSALFAALCVMAQVRPSAYVDLRWDELDAALAVKRERELTWRMSKNVGKRRDGDETSEARASVDRT